MHECTCGVEVETVSKIVCRGEAECGWQPWQRLQSRVRTLGPIVVDDRQQHFSVFCM